MSLTWEQTKWPDTELDRKAYEQAKRELAIPECALHLMLPKLLQRAQQIKTEWKEEK